MVLLSFGSGATAEKRHGHVHVHGIASINVAVEGTKAIVEFRAPAENIIGFEHEAKSQSDKKRRDAAFARLQEGRDHMFVFDPKLGCRSSEMKTAMAEKGSVGTEKRSGNEQGKKQKSGEHREVYATLSVVCDKPLAGSRLQFGVHKLFPEIHEIEVQVLSDSRQSATTIKRDKGDVVL
jgi:hypothetical protein